MKKTENEPFEYQGKTRKQVEDSYRIFVWMLMICGAWLGFYGFFKLLKWFYALFIAG